MNGLLGRSIGLDSFKKLSRSVVFSTAKRLAAASRCSASRCSGWRQRLYVSVCIEICVNIVSQWYVGNRPWLIDALRQASN